MGCGQTPKSAWTAARQWCYVVDQVRRLELGVLSCRDNSVLPSSLVGAKLME